MKNLNLKTVFGACLALGAFTMTQGAVAAENAAGVKKFMEETVKNNKDAQAAAAAGNKEGCLTAIKATKQSYKEITGDAAGKPMQDAIKRVKEAQAECEGGSTAKAAEILAEVSKTMEAIAANIK